MGSNPVSSDMLEAFRILMIAGYAAGLVGCVYAAFGIVRTVATKLPVPSGDHEYYGLFLLDIGPKLYSFDGRGKKAMKLVVYGLVAVLFFGVWWSALYFTYQAGDALFLWMWGISAWVTVMFHVMVLVGVLVPFANRARSHANKFTPSDD